MVATRRTRATSASKPAKKAAAKGAKKRSVKPARPARETKAKAAARAEIRAVKVASEHAAALSAIAHDLRNPLSVILVSIRLLDRALGDHAAKRHLDGLARAADEMGQILQDMSDARRIEAGELVVDGEPIDLGELLDQPMALATHAASAKHVRVTSTIEPELPKVHGDRDRLRRALATLLNNGVRYAPRDSEVDLKISRADDRLLVEVSDLGPGLGADDVKLAFSRVVRRPAVQGTGLAMFVARGVVEALGGKAGVKRRDAGATFYVELPIAGV